MLQWVIFRKYDNIIYYFTMGYISQIWPYFLYYVTMGYISQIWPYNILYYNGLYFANMTIQYVRDSAGFVWKLWQTARSYNSALSLRAQNGILSNIFLFGFIEAQHLYIIMRTGQLNLVKLFSIQIRGDLDIL